MKEGLCSFKNKRILIIGILLFLMCTIISGCVFWNNNKNIYEQLSKQENVVSLLPRMVNEIQNDENSDNWVYCGSCVSGIRFVKNVDYSEDEEWSFKFHVKITDISESSSKASDIEKDFELNSLNNETSFNFNSSNLSQLEITEESDSDYSVVISGLADGKIEGNKYVGTFTPQTSSYLVISINNKYKYRDLVIKKTIEGSLKNSNDEFTFNIKLKNDDGELSNSYTYLVNDKEETLSLKEENDYMVGTIMMKANDKVTLKKLPLNTTYVINEEDMEGYEEVTKEVTGEISSNNDNEVNFINKVVEKSEKIEEKEEVQNPNTNSFISYMILAIVLTVVIVLFVFYRKYHNLTK